MKQKFYLWYANHALQIYIWMQLATVALLMYITWGTPTFTWVVLLSLVDSGLGILQSNAFGVWYKTMVDQAQKMYYESNTMMRAAFDDAIKQAKDMGGQV